MLYSLLTFFGLEFIFNQFYVIEHPHIISFISAFIILIIENTKIIKDKCNCGVKKPNQEDI
jgi:hypothetical protein